MASYYQSVERGFRLFELRDNPAWRLPQLGALGAIQAHWSLGVPEAALVSLPTGVGKTAVAMAVPHLFGAKRTLIVVPSAELRRQTVTRFINQLTLRQIGSLIDDSCANPRVAEVAKRVHDWEQLKAYDVVVALPNSISPEHYNLDSQPPPDLFDLIIVDEAHHAPAPTWNAILKHFVSARSLLLTATPRRRDRKKVPGKLIYYYPLRKALEEHLFQPVNAIALSVSTPDRKDHDTLIMNKVVELLGTNEHRSSQLLIRASTVDRASALARQYSEKGLSISVIHSRLSKREQAAILEDLREARLRGVAVVGMLIEGFDLPSLRIAAYHDKHKSLETTAQLIGRLARVDDRYPQQSQIVTVNDIDIYPQLKGAVRALYEEDHDWAKVLPGIIDADIEEDLKDIEYARSFVPLVSTIDPSALHPLRRAIILEQRANSSWEPPFLSLAIPGGLAVGATIEGQQVIYSALSPDRTSLLLVTGQIERPRWHNGDALDAARYELHVISYRRSSHTQQPSLLLLNTPLEGFVSAILNLLEANDEVVPADPSRLQRAFDSLERISVSSVGVRNTFLSRGVPSYRMFAGSGIEGGLRHADTSHASLGHAMVQVSGDASAFTAGVSTGKSKYWETRYTSLRDYDAFTKDLAERYWFPPTPPTGPLLPQVSRGSLLVDWPDSPPIVIELDYALVGAEWDIDGKKSLDRVEFRVGHSYDSEHLEDWPLDFSQGLPISGHYPSAAGMETIWTGHLRLDGTVVATGTDLIVSRGYSAKRSLSQLLTERPPTIYFFDGTSVVGRMFHKPQTVPAPPLDGILEPIDWSGVDIVAETRTSATKRKKGISVHEALERYIWSRPVKGKHRWLLCNDGAGEMADYISIELSDKAVFLGLWHAKYSGREAPGVRVTDLQEVVAQAIKSRRWLTDARFWKELSSRLRGDSSPKAELIKGKRRALEIVLGEHAHGQKIALTRRRPQVVGEIHIIQPGLSRGALIEAIASPSAPTSAIQIQQLLSVWQDSMIPVATGNTALCSA